MRPKILISGLIFAFVFGSHVPTPAIAAPVSECRISEAPFQTVSLGFPVASERLKYKTKPKIMVLPYRLSDRPTYEFGNEAKNEYLAAGRIIEKYSGGLSVPEFVFAQTVDVPETVADMVILRQNQQQQWQRDEAKSTWGFIRKLIASSDPKIDFTGIDGVIMHGSSTSNDSWIAEAMMFSKNPRDPWFRTIKTAEGEILNAVLLDKRNTIATIAHEIMHLYGLTDLYGSQQGPGLLSLMASNEDTLLSYEKWVLGWIPDSQVQCVVESKEIDPNQVSTRIKVPTNPGSQIVVINTGSATSAMIIETLNVNANKYLAFYSLDNEARPPITMHAPLMSAPSSGLLISQFYGVGTQLVSPKYHLLVTDNTETELTLDLIPKAQISNATNLITQANANRARIQQAAANANKPELVKSVKKKTITCAKGNVVRKVTATKPTCPTGFTKKR